MEPDRKCPVGIQTFSEIRKGHYVYIDKTDLVWQMTRMKFVFLSRPRRFGKSLLTTTLDAYFKGQKDLFKGLKIMGLETEWEQYPVIRIDVSWAKNKITSAELQRALVMMLKPLAAEFGRDEEEVTPGEILTGMIPSYTGLDGSSVQDGFALKFWRTLAKSIVNATTFWQFSGGF